MSMAGRVTAHDQQYLTLLSLLPYIRLQAVTSVTTSDQASQVMATAVSVSVSVSANSPPLPSSSMPAGNAVLHASPARATSPQQNQNHENHENQRRLQVEEEAPPPPPAALEGGSGEGGNGEAATTCTATATATPQRATVATSQSVTMRAKLPEAVLDITPPTTDPTAKTPAPPASPSTTERPRHHPPLSNIFHFHHGASDTSHPPAPSTHMFFKTGAGTAAHRRKSLANTTAITNYEADLTSRDRAKQKEAVKKYLLERVKDDWKWEWPRVEDSSSPDATQELEAEAMVEEHTNGETTQSEAVNGESNPAEAIEEHWQERDEWLSNASESDPEPASKVLAGTTPNPTTSPFRFENPDNVGETIQKTLRDRKRRRKRRNKEERVWNDGVRCYMERRDAWTGARRKQRHPIPAKRSSVSTEDGGSSTALENEEDGWEDSDTEVPVAPPILPPTNAMRASITPDAYNTIYDKVIIQQLTPSCPMNLQDVIRSCVHGWVRDNEWPPKATGGPIVVPKPKKKLRKLSVAGIFGLDKDKDSKEPTSPGGIRRGLQRLMSLGKEGGTPPASPVADKANANGNSNGSAENGHTEGGGEAVGPPV